MSEEDASSQVESHRRLYGGLRGRTPEGLAYFWKAWSEYDQPMEQAVTWADVKANIVEKELAASATNDP